MQVLLGGLPRCVKTLTFDGYVMGREPQVNSGRGRLESDLSYESEAGDELTRATEEFCNPYQRIEWAVLVQYGRLWIAVYITIVWPTMKAGRT